MVSHPLTLLLHSGVAVGPGPGLAHPVLVGVARVDDPGTANLWGATPQTGEAKVVHAVALGHAVELASSAPVTHARDSAGLEA